METHKRQYKMTKQKIMEFPEQENKSWDNQMRPAFEVKSIEFDKLHEEYEVDGRVKNNKKLS